MPFCGVGPVEEVGRVEHRAPWHADGIGVGPAHLAEGVRRAAPGPGGVVVTGQFRVEPAGLLLASGRLAASSDTLGAVDLSGPLDDAAAALSGSATAGSAGRADDELTGAVRRLSTAVDAMSSSAQTTAENYTGSESSIAQVFTSAAPFLPGTSRSDISAALDGPSW